MKVKVSKKPEKKAPPEVEVAKYVRDLPKCPWEMCFTIYGPEGGPAKLLADPETWFNRPHEGWVALYSVVGKTFAECMASYNKIEADRAAYARV